MSDETIHESIREALPVVGRTILEVTCDDWDEVKAKQPNHEFRVSQVYLHLDDGSTIALTVGNWDGLAIGVELRDIPEKPAGSG